MKRLILISLLVISFCIVHAQQASDYFPEHPIAWWEYKITLLDSLNNEIDSLYYFRQDRFITESTYDGKLAKIVETKSGPKETINFQPYLDSLIYNFEGSNGYEHFKVGFIEHLFGCIDSLITDTTVNVVSFFQSLEQWYSVYRFAQNLNDEYTILQLDTTVIVDTLTLPLRLKITGERLEDETIVAPIGTLNCKKFKRKIELSYLVIIPPLPPIPIPILVLNDYIWIAENFWIVQGMIPSIDVDLSAINNNWPSFYIPGLITKLEDIVDVEEEFTLPEEIALTQNYPNPFNPSTTIKFSFPSSGYATLKIYNAIGEEVTVLLDKELNIGTYELEWNAAGLPSGMYFYQLKTEGFVETKKMILLK